MIGKTLFILLQVALVIIVISFFWILYKYLNRKRIIKPGSTLGLFIKSYLRPIFFNAKQEIYQKVVHYAIQNEVKGAYFEFGSYRGDSLIIFNYYAKRYKYPVTNFYIFDSFEGLPESKEESNELETMSKGMYACDKERFIKNIKKGKVDINRVNIFEGFYKDTLNKETEKKIKDKASIIMIDCDLYSSTKEVLNFIIPFLQSGTVILFDEWYLYRGKGEKRAFDEWIKKHPNIEAIQFHKFGWEGNSFIINLD